MAKSARFSELQYQEHLEKLRHSRAEPTTESKGVKRARAATKALTLATSAAQQPSPKAGAGKTGLLSEIAKPAKAKRQGVKEQPIMEGLESAQVAIEASATHLTIALKGARLFTLNEMYAILQYRSYVAFAYKKLLRARIREAFGSLPHPRPRFDTPCKMTMYRAGAKLTDRDNFEAMFKALIDALKDEKREGFQGAFPDDNPDIIYDDAKIQAKGSPLIALRFDLILPIPVPDHEAPVDALFAGPISWVERKALRQARRPATGATPETPAALAPKSMLKAKAAKTAVNKKTKSKTRADEKIGPALP